MNDNEKKLVMGLVLKSITKEEFLKEYPVDIQQDKQYVTKVLKDALIRKDPDDVEHALLLGFSFEFEEGVVPVLCELIVQDWHFKHEDMARLLQDFKRPDSIESLYKTALMELDYLDYDDSYALAVKCIWALGGIDTDSSRDKLRQLALSENQVVKEAAEHQLNRAISS